jgi:LAO/AO transport system kinase
MSFIIESYKRCLSSCLIHYSIYLLSLQHMAVQHQLIQHLHSGDTKALARCITMVENNLPGSLEILASLQIKTQVPVIGITGPPGAGKSTLINALIKELTVAGKKVGIIAIDPTSPFNYGSLLGDRLRMAEHFNNPNVYIRSLATRGSLGGLSAKAIEVVDVMRSSTFDYIFVETVGVGQSEIEIVGLADTTILVLVPEAGDDVQAIKSGIMEIADIFVINKSDREGADLFMKNIVQMVHEKSNANWNIPVIKTIATKYQGVKEIIEKINAHHLNKSNDKKSYLLAEKLYKLIEQKRMSNVSKKELRQKVLLLLEQNNFNIYQLIKEY